MILNNSLATVSAIAGLMTFISKTTFYFFIIMQSLSFFDEYFAMFFFLTVFYMANCNRNVIFERIRAIYLVSAVTSLS